MAEIIAERLVPKFINSANVEPSSRAYIPHLLDTVVFLDREAVPEIMSGVPLITVHFKIMNNGKSDIVNTYVKVRWLSNIDWMSEEDILRIIGQNFT